ncbi:MAG: hypothetical protein KJ749_09320 [Planctomycetes bacterium]|nr:hypothetical protein [Planctomycetota bacterium]
MIRETEIALLVGFVYPDRARRIPTVEVGHGTFHPSFATRFWQETLELSDDEIDLLERTAVGASDRFSR